MSTEQETHMNRLFVLMQYLLPQHALSRIVHWAARVRAVWFKNALIRSFVRAYRVDMSDAEQTEPTAYENFNAFFTRALRPDARPLPASPAEIACPVDGSVSISGMVRDGELIQAKDRRYRLPELLGDDPMAREFEDGFFITLYLAPYNYHRIHMPASGRLTDMRYIPGRLFSVNAATVRSVPRLFARNERVVCRFETPDGPMVMVLVGALNVGSIETVWAGEVAPGRPRRPSVATYRDGVTLTRGQEMGRFNMGSTVILAFPPGRAVLSGTLLPGRSVRMGETLGRWSPSSDQPSSAAT
jgi:phosphatidylserine decarboxylase